ncbi:MAG: beta-N-acetylhexosaminidase [Odoribacter sp.]|nr:beta-N-acetylhexosaminidase [Odoribacter sp.]
MPYPQTVELSSNHNIIITPHLIFDNPQLEQEAYLFLELLEEFEVSIKKKPNKKDRVRAIILDIDSQLPAESYKITIDEKGVVVKGGDKAGVFYGLVTLAQQINNGEKFAQTAVPRGVIKDSPRYSWRGFMLDEARHFFGKEKVKQLLDLMAYYKLNKFHWHLSDEEGWRIEIKKYPLLTTVGGKGNWTNMNGSEAYFYTQEDIREIVAYAAERHIEIIPEIDMPGHATAANRAYSYLSGGADSKKPHFTFNVGKEEVYSFLGDVLREVADLFPSPYLHIGGDEVSFGIEAWNTDPDVQKLMREKGMKELREAERYFMHRMIDTVNALGKTIIGWDEIVDLNVDTAKSEVLWWRHDRVNMLKKALNRGYTTIMCPRRPLYFDFIQHKDHKWGRVWNGFCPLEDVYSFPDKGLSEWDIPESDLKLIKGMQANLWTERVHTEQRLDFMIFPRLCALAESAWTEPANKDFSNFEIRLEQAYRLFDNIGIYYFDHRNPSKHAEPAGAVQKDKDVPMDFRD